MINGPASLAHPAPESARQNRKALAAVSEDC